MLLVRSLRFSVGVDFTGALVDHALAAVDPSVPVWTFLEDPSGGKVSAVARVLKKQPALARLGPPRQGTIRHQLTSLPEREYIGEPFAFPISHAEAREVANGIPKSLPFNYSKFLIGPVPELWLASEPAPPLAVIGSHSHAREILGAVMVSSSWWTSGRQLGLEAHLGMTAPTDNVKKLPPLPPETRRVIDALGRVHREEHLLLPDSSESAARASAEPAAEQLVAQTDLSGVELPHPDLANDAHHGDGEAFGSFKDTLRELLPGYRYQSKLGGRGIWVLSKRTKLHNELLLKVDRGPLGGNASAWLSIRGPLWSHGFTLPVSRSATQLRVWQAGTTFAVCRNWAAAIEAIERDVIPDLERLYWPGFAWYSSGTA